MASALRATSRTSSVVPMAVGVLVLIGWAADIEILKRIVPGLTAMNPATAVGFVCVGCSLALLARSARVRITPATRHEDNGGPGGTSGPERRRGRVRRRALRRAAVSLAMVTVVLGLSRFVALLGPWDPEVDQLLFREKLAFADFGRPNRMAPNTAANFVLIGIAIAVVDRSFGRFRWPAQVLAVTGAMTSLLALMGYAYGLRAFYGIGSHIAMALPTAICFLVAAVGVLCARPTDGVMAVITSDTSGGTMIRRLLPAVLIVPAALGGLRLAGQQVALFDTAFGVWLLVIALMTVFAVLVGRNALLLFRADLDRADAEKRLAHQATHDALTQLPNRRLFVDSLAAALEQGRAAGTSTAVLFVDLDLFKVINDSLGHMVGDELLRTAGSRIQRCLGPGAIVARLSGDEFTVLLPGLTSRDPALDLAGRIREAFNLPFSVGMHEVFTSVSIGIAFSEGDESPWDLVRHADIAMYRAKARGKGRYEVFDAAMDQAAMQRLRLESDLRRAIARGELRLYYQPEVAIESGRLVGMEALVRWEHPTRGLMSPSEFLPVAEETGLILPIGRWVLLEACRQAKEWHATYPHDLPLMVSVNLSGKHLQQATLVDEVREVLETTGLDPGHLIIEITETVAMAGAETTIQVLTRLKALGVLLAIDDFGTGFSSLAYLKRFPVDLLKIDKSFVDGVALRGHDAAIVEAIIALGHALGLQVIAEGVETPDQLLKLRALGSEIGQGYFFSHPLSDDVRDGMPSRLAAHLRWSADGGYWMTSGRVS